MAEDGLGDRPQINDRIDMGLFDQLEVILFLRQFACRQDNQGGMLAAKFRLDARENFQVVGPEGLLAKNVSDQSHRGQAAAVPAGRLSGPVRDKGSLGRHAVDQPFRPQFGQRLAHGDLVDLVVLGQVVHGGQTGKRG